MKAPGCDWRWMAEADDDGRLTNHQQTSFRRHVDHCIGCAQAAADVSRLRQRMEAVAEPALGDVQHHRQRQLLLARAGGRQARSLRERLAWPRMLAASALAVAAIGVVAWRLGGGPSDAAAAAPRYEVTGLAGASWTNEEEGATARVRLSRGSAAFHVHKLNAGQRFFVTLPDGEIEVRGTRFVVDIAEGHTRYVVVMEGKVAFRQGEGGERLLLAGQRWDAPSEASRADEGHERASEAPAAPPAMNPAATRTGTRARLRASASHHGAPAAAAESPVVAQSRAVEPSAAPAPPPETTPNLFARGIQAFRAGRYAEAEGLWRDFVAEHPQDPRVEDIAFLRAVVRARVGDVGGAAALARAYLERFPRGMRRKEAEALIRHASQ